MNTPNIFSKTSLFLLLFLVGTLGVLAQDNSKVKEMKIGFITDKLSLTEAEAKKFWPIYDEYQAEKEEIRNEYGNKTDSEAEINKKEAEITLLKKYNTKFKEVLPSEKASKVFEVETQFKKVLIEHLKGQR